ncbi:MAG: PHP domain-containing protein [Elusimicrobiota bacterium]|jgi:predicted metal-dependent phosphoesterase TrpH|nr:PHP domain-containing protein [Elusimicrobiota bacterium]
MPIIDLHSHTKYSDGTATPAQTVFLCVKAGVKMMAITDHDTVEAVEECRAGAREAGIIFINGVEISAREHDYLHILGYKIDVKNKRFEEFLAQNRRLRNERVKRIIKNLQANGILIEEENVFSTVTNVASRAHIADALKRAGIVSSRQEGFKKYLAKGKAAYAAPEGADITEIIKQIKLAGGKAFLAHPGAVREIWDFPRWVNCGLDGIEVYYPTHNAQTQKDLLQIAKKYGLTVSAGSDFHGAGSGRRNKLGIEVPQEIFECLRENLC